MTMLYLTHKNETICPLCQTRKAQFDGSCLVCKKKFIMQSEEHLHSEHSQKDEVKNKSK